MFAAMNLDPESASSLRLRIVDLAAIDPEADPDVDLGPLVAVGSAADIAAAHAQPWLERATFTLTEDSVDDRRVVTVPSVAASTEELVQRVDRWPQAAAICDDVLRLRRSGRADVERARHRIARLFDVAVGPRIQGLAGSSRTGVVAEHPRSRFG